MAKEYIAVKTTIFNKKNIRHFLYLSICINSHFALSDEVKVISVSDNRAVLDFFLEQPPAVEATLLKQAIANESNAQFQVAEFYSQGSDSAKADTEQAIFWYQQAIKNGSPRARSALALLAFKQLLLIQDEQQTIQWQADRKVVNTKPYSYSYYGEKLKWAQLAANNELYLINNHYY